MGCDLGRTGVDLGSIRDRTGVDQRSLCGGLAIPLGSKWGRIEVQLRKLQPSVHRKRVSYTVRRTVLCEKNLCRLKNPAAAKSTPPTSNASINVQACAASQSGFPQHVLVALRPSGGYTPEALLIRGCPLSAFRREGGQRSGGATAAQQYLPAIKRLSVRSPGARRSGPSTVLRAVPPTRHRRPDPAPRMVRAGPGASAAAGSRCTPWRPRSS